MGQMDRAIQTIGKKTTLFRSDYQHVFVFNSREMVSESGFPHGCLMVENKTTPKRFPVNLNLSNSLVHPV